MRGVIYARYSSEKQTEQSIEGQIRVCKEFCKQNNIQVVDIYIDRAVSAAKDIENRVAFLQMIKDSEKRKWDCVVVYKLDRFARNRYDSAIYKNKLRKNGVKVISATENISDTPEGIILESVLEGMAEFYSKELAQKVMRGMRESALKAQSTGGTIPLGYKIENKKLVIDEVYAPLVKMVFQMYADGYPMSKIVQAANAAGYRTRKGKPFTRNSFRTLLTNRKYIGIYTYNNEIEIEGGVPALIDKETFEKVQARLKRNALAPARGKAKVDYLLTGKLFCGQCGAPMAGDSVKKKNDIRYHYYTCSMRKRFGNCCKKSLRKDDIETLVIRTTVEKVLTDENINLIADIAIRELEKEKDNNTVLAALKTQKKEIEKAINNLLKLVEHGAVSDSLSKRLNELEEEKAAIEHRIFQEEKSLPVLTKEHVIFWLQEFKKGNIHDIAYQRHLIDMLVNSVIVTDDPDGDQKITIAYNLSQDAIEYRLSDWVNSSDLSALVNQDPQNPNLFVRGSIFGITVMISQFP